MRGFHGGTVGRSAGRPPGGATFLVLAGPGGQGRPLIRQFHDHVAKDPCFSLWSLSPYGRGENDQEAQVVAPVIPAQTIFPPAPLPSMMEMGQAAGTGSRGSGQAVIPLRM